MRDCVCVCTQETRLAFSMDTTPGLGRDLCGTSVMANELQWTEQVGADGVAVAKLTTHVIMLPVQTQAGKDAEAASETFVRCLQLVSTPIQELVKAGTPGGLKWFDVESDPVEPVRLLLAAKRTSQIAGDDGAGHLDCANSPLALLPPQGYSSATPTAGPSLSSDRLSRLPLWPSSPLCAPF